jgi:hypothetical protein
MAGSHYLTQCLASLAVIPWTMVGLQAVTGRHALYEPLLDGGFWAEAAFQTGKWKFEGALGLRYAAVVVMMVNPFLVRPSHG